MTGAVITIDGQRVKHAAKPLEPIKLRLLVDPLPVAEVVELPERVWDAWAPTEPAELEVPRK